MKVPNRVKQIFTEHNRESIFLYNGSKKTLRFIILVSSIVIFPLAIKNFYLGYNLLTFSLLSFIAASFLYSQALHRGAPPTINSKVVVSLLVFSLFLTIYHLGTDTIYWIYPVSTSLIFILKLKEAIVFNVVILIFVTGFCFLDMETAAALRVSASFALTIMISSLILVHINKLQQRIVYESIRDPLTGAFNRRQLQVNLESCLAQMKRNNQHSALLILDIDHFKNINDSYGHDVGDEVIKKVVNLIDENTRELDLLFRIGGEEFILLMQDTYADAALIVADKLRNQIKQKSIIENHQVTVSIGMCLSQVGDTKDQWIKCADMALFDAKRSGRDRVKLYQPEND